MLKCPQPPAIKPQKYSSQDSAKYVTFDYVKLVPTINPTKSDKVVKPPQDSENIEAVENVKEDVKKAEDSEHDEFLSECGNQISEETKNLDKLIKAAKFIAQIREPIITEDIKEYPHHYIPRFIKQIPEPDEQIPIRNSTNLEPIQVNYSVYNKFEVIKLYMNFDEDSQVISYCVNEMYKRIRTRETGLRAVNRKKEQLKKEISYIISTSDTPEI